MSLKLIASLYNDRYFCFYILKTADCNNKKIMLNFIIFFPLSENVYVYIICIFSYLQA